MWLLFAFLDYFRHFLRCDISVNPVIHHDYRRKAARTHTAESAEGELHIFRGLPHVDIEEAFEFADYAVRTLYKTRGSRAYVDFIFPLRNNCEIRIEAYHPENL